MSSIEVTFLSALQKIKETHFPQTSRCVWCLAEIVSFHADIYKTKNLIKKNKKNKSVVLNLPDTLMLIVYLQYVALSENNKQTNTI